MVGGGLWGLWGLERLGKVGKFIEEMRWVRFWRESISVGNRINGNKVKGNLG